MHGFTVGRGMALQCARMCVCFHMTRHDIVFFVACFSFSQVCNMNGARKSMRIAGCVRLSDRLSFLGKSRVAIKEMEKAIAILGEDIQLLEEVSQQVSAQVS